MQCEIRGMRDVAEGAPPGTDTLPRPGRVNEVCREWLVKEDGALATRLQTEEFQQHYTGNKSRNAQVREDFPRARDEQRREEETAAAVRNMYRQIVLQQEEVDATVARQLAERLEREESERRRALEEEDKLMARRMQERERQQLQRKSAALPDVAQIHYDRDMNSVGLPSPPELSLAEQFRVCALSDAAVQTNSGYASPDASPLGDLEEEQARLLQEQRDAELARRLQEQEGGVQRLSMLDQDRLMAIEAQDKELARLLQEKERAKARRARERARQRALSKRQGQGGTSEDEGAALTSPAGSLAEWAEPVPLHSTAVRPTELDLSGPRRSRHRYQDPEAIEVCHSSPEPGPSHGLPNIAMVIDPTYPRRATVDTPLGSPPVAIPPQVYEEEEDDSPVPPYMPIQGQRRIASLEKKGRRGRSKDACKQQ
ncbi:coiled-coil domain-containing protein 50 isoform X3 [Bacillus rossius redtenbacheri]|uniref:coiled-coil domain-containing protein 50 isoform X3 n=1 Tax=Bacillus rossius redtenbacheri TaxID=93214 RepID=UPI002FDE7520